MDGKVFGILGFLLGGGVGAASTYIYMKKRTDKRIEEEVRKFKEDYTKRNDIPVSEGRDPVEKELSDNSPMLHATSSIDNGPVDISRTNYHKVLSDMSYQGGEEKKEDPAESEAPTEDDIPKNGEAIHIITVEEYEDTIDIGKANLIWYVTPDILMDEFEEEVEERDILLGNCLENTRDEIIEKDEDVTIYIRNEGLDVDYEIDVVVNRDPREE